MTEFIRAEVVREGIRFLKEMARTRIPKYDLPADSFLELYVTKIIEFDRQWERAKWTT